MQQTVIKNKAEARQKAIDWAIWQATQNLSYLELAEWNEYFTALAEQFGLKDEFAGNGIIS